MNKRHNKNVKKSFMHVYPVKSQCGSVHTSDTQSEWHRGRCHSSELLQHSRTHSTLMSAPNSTSDKWNSDCNLHCLLMSYLQFNILSETVFSSMLYYLPLRICNSFITSWYITVKQKGHPFHLIRRSVLLDLLLKYNLLWKVTLISPTLTCILCNTIKSNSVL